MPRSPAQKAATRRMLAANRRGGGRRSRGVSPGPRRRGRKNTVIHASGVGGVAFAAGETVVPNQSGDTAVKALLRKDYSGALYGLKQQLPVVGKDPFWAQGRSVTTAGAALILADIGAKALHQRFAVRVGKLQFVIGGR
ncbi:MAG: hypothetical protein ACYDDA_13295 [Acidiferrobacteraceae bacterium]